MRGVVSQNFNDIVVKLARNVRRQPTAKPTRGNARFDGVDAHKLFDEREETVIFDVEFLDNRFETAQALIRLLPK